MNAVGECVSRPVFGRSTPRGASAPPITRRQRPDGLDRVVGLREQRQVGGRGHVLAGRAELRQPEAVQVRLVADDEVADGREAPDDVGRPGDEVGAVGVSQRRHARAERIQRQDDPDPVEIRGSDRVLEAGGRRRVERRLPARPLRAQPQRVEPGELREVHPALREPRVGLQDDVVGGADEQVRAARAGGRGGHEHGRREQAEQNPLHDPSQG